MRRHPHLFLGLPRGVFETFWVFRGAFWQSDRRGGRHSLHYALAHPTKMAEAWRRERAIVRLYDHPDDGNECSAIIVRIDEEGVRVRVKDLLTGSSSAGMRSSEIVVREDQLGPLAPPEGVIDPPEKPATLSSVFSAKPVCLFSRGANEDPGLARAIQTTVDLSPAERRRLNNCTRIKALENAVKDKLEDSKFNLGCVRAGKEAMEACGSTNPIVRFAWFNLGYADAVGRGVTHEDLKMWLAKPAYWEDTINIAEAAATNRDNRTPTVYITVSKCAADNYCAQMRRDENLKVRKHRITLDEIRRELGEMFPTRLIILLDIPARLFGCARSKKTSEGYTGCTSVTAAGKVILRHMLMVLLPTAAACGFDVAGIVTICADITEEWLLDTIHGPTSLNPLPMMHGTVANFPRMRMEWYGVHDRIVVGRGLHYVFMHLQEYKDVAEICLRLTVIALGINRKDEDIGIGSENHAIMIKIAFMFHTLAGALGRAMWKEAQIDAALNNPDVNQLPPDWNQRLKGWVGVIDLDDF